MSNQYREWPVRCNRSDLSISEFRLFVMRVIRQEQEPLISETENTLTVTLVRKSQPPFCSALFSHLTPFAKLF
jgi:hypothetical protein